MRRAREVDDTGLIPFIDTEAAARYLALSPHSLECYRSLGGGPPFYKFGKFVRYAVGDLETMHRHARFMTRTAEPPGWTSQFRELVLEVAADLHDLRGGAAALIPALDPDSYDEAQDSRRRSGPTGQKVLFTPASATPAVSALRSSILTEPLT